MKFFVNRVAIYKYLVLCNNYCNERKKGKEEKCREKKERVKIRMTRYSCPLK